LEHWDLRKQESMGVIAKPIAVSQSYVDGPVAFAVQGFPMAVVFEVKEFAKLLLCWKRASTASRAWAIPRNSAAFG
jgi:hypothetical protein